MSKFEDERVERYSRQILFEPIGEAGQNRLGDASVVVLGCGALGSIQCEMLTRAGIGHLTVIDRDYLDWTNLQRQSLFTESDVRQRLPKAVAAARHLRSMNSDIEIREVVEDLNRDNALELLGNCHVLLDGTDNFETRFLVNEVAIQLKLPWIYGACVGSYAMTATFLPSRPPCFNCLLEDFQLGGLSPTCDTHGIIAPAVHWAASIQITEALKILLRMEEALHHSLLTWDVWSTRYQRVLLMRLGERGCKVCRGGSFPYLGGEKGTPTTVLCGRNAVLLHPQQRGKIDLEELEKRLSGLSRVTRNDYLLQAIVDGLELVVFADGRGMVRGTNEIAAARSLYAKYVGA